MKFTIFKGQKPDAKPTTNVFTPPGVTNRPTPASPSTPAAKLSEGPETSIPLQLTSILPQLPRDLFGNRDKSELAGITLAVSSRLILPQLSSGKVIVTLTELAPSLPADLVNPTALEQAGTQTIQLPLAQMIAAIPPESFSIQHENVVSLDSPELAGLPGLFEEETVTAVAPPPPPAPAPAKRLSDTQQIPATPEQQPAPPPAPTRIALDTNIPQQVRVTLRGLVTGIPDKLFVCPKSELGQRTNLDAAVLLPVEPMLPQLQTARVTMPLVSIIPLIPAIILVKPLPRLDDLVAVLPLFEIIPQLPSRLFTAQLSSTQPHEFEAVETEIPTPFQERAPRVVTQPTPTLPVEPEVEEQLTEIAAEELEKEEIAIFTEKTTAPPVGVPKIEPLVVEPVRAAVPPPPPIEPAATAPVEPTGMPRVLDEKKFLIDLNRCCVEDLIRIEGVGRTMAQRIIDFRNNRGQFTSVDELRLIPGIGAKTFRALTGVEPRSLNKLLGVEDDRELTLQEIVKLTGTLRGVEGCMLAMADGLFLTGQLPEHLDQEAISVFAPQLFKKVGRYVKELKVGQVRRFTLFTDQRPISVFRAGDVYLIVIHDTRHFSKRLLRQCERISQEIARLCRQRTVV